MGCSGKFFAPAGSVDPRRLFTVNRRSVVKVRTVYLRQRNGYLGPVVWSPRWGEGGEVPVHVVEYAEASLRLFASGTAELVMLEMPITVRMPVTVGSSGSRLLFPQGCWREALMALRKITPSAGSPNGGGPGVEDAKTWPTLVEYLTVTAYPDGQPRVPSALVVVADASGWRGCLSDKDNARSLWKVSSTLEGLLLALEEAAASDDPGQWRQSAEGKWKGRKRT